MRYNKFKYIFFFSLVFLIFGSQAYGETFDYKILPSENFIDVKATTAEIDQEKRKITLPKTSLTDIIKFTQDETYDYAVLTKTGLKHYAFDGEGMVLNPALSIEVEDPLALAINQSEEYSECSIVQRNNEDNTFDIVNYQYGGDSFIETPALSISGLQTIFSLSKTDYGTAVLTEDSLKLFIPSEDGLVEIPSLGVSDIKDPISMAASSDGYSIAILTKDKSSYYHFNGASLLEIPALGISIDQNHETPKAIAINGDKVSILYDEQLSSYQLNEATGEMEYHSGLSITSGLVKPLAFALNKGTEDVVVIDEIDAENKKFRAKYFMFNGQEMMELETLEIDLPEITSGLKYQAKGEVISQIITPEADYADYIKVRAYTETPKGTKITFYVANAGNDLKDANWQESWRVENSTENQKGSFVYKFNPKTKSYDDYGLPPQSYPSYDPQSEDSTELTDIEVKLDPNGNPVLNDSTEDGQASNLWTYIPIENESGKTNGEYKKIRIKAVLETSDTSVTPSIFAPLGTNNAGGIQSTDDTAIRVDTGTQSTPIIDEIDSGHGDPANHPPVEGWVYTTTPEISWYYENPDTSQIATQIIVLAKKDSGDWEIAYNSGRVATTDSKFKIPTSNAPDIAGPLYEADSFTFRVFARTWNNANVPSDFSEGEEFKVLAFERPRIAQIINAPGSIKPVIDNPASHFLIKPEMGIGELPQTKAGAAVTLIMDSVGPIRSDLKENAYVYVTLAQGDMELNLGKCEATKVPGNTANNRWTFTFWTDANIPNDTIIKAKFVGPGVVGGTTTYYLPPIADGLLVTNDTIYTDWQVTLQGSERK